MWTRVLNKNSTSFAQECTVRLFLAIGGARGRRRRLVSVCRDLPPITKIASPAGDTWPRGKLASGAAYLPHLALPIQGSL
ncbi:jg6892 [Pararge aegeria aegeria]|uniref:Jg6892 protein n=1 Tax=Pararge aegeria aegeria TaxID=348720 RepID=A0A8S4RQV8_9NEOP|nr:jg6892 [Pararge aegeria aegeria]